MGGTEESMLEDTGYSLEAVQGISDGQIRAERLNGGLEAMSTRANLHGLQSVREDQNASQV